MTFATAVPVLFTSFVYCTSMYWSVIHGIKRKPHLSVAWNWYHFVAIAILHQPSPFHTTDAWWFSLKTINIKAADGQVVQGASRDQYVCAPSQWETTLHCNIIHVQNTPCSDSSALALELLHSCANPSMCGLTYWAVNALRITVLHWFFLWFSIDKQGQPVSPS